MAFWSFNKIDANEYGRPQQIQRTMIENMTHTTMSTI